jgi:hypothetical protein
MQRQALIEADDDVYGGPIVGQFIANGSSPNAVVTIWRAVKGGRGRLTQVDRLTGAEIKPQPDGTLTVVGTSTLLRKHIGVSDADARLALRLTPQGGCADCP